MAFDRSDKATTEMLRRSLEGQSGDAGSAIGECPEPEILAAYFERSLDPEETARYELHLSQCLRCREQLAVVTRAGELSRPTEETRRAASWSWVWDWRWLAPVAAALILATVWTAQRPLPKQTTSAQPQAPLVAMSQPDESTVARDRKEVPQATTRPAPSARDAAPPASYVAPNPPLDKTQNALSRDMGRLAPSNNERENVAAEKRKDEDSNLAKKPANAPLRDSGVRTKANDAESQTSAGVPQSVPLTTPPAAPAPSQGVIGGAMAHAETDTRSDDALQPKQMDELEKSRLYAQKYDEATPATAGRRTAAVVVRTPNPKVLWQLPEQGLLKSEDGGATWRKAELPVANAHFVSVAAPSAQVCWVVGRAGIILLTTDGLHWQTIAPPATVDFVQVAAENASSAKVTMADGRTFETADAGEHWHPRQ